MWGELVSIGANLFGGNSAAYAEEKAADETRKANMEEAAKNREFQHEETNAARNYNTEMVNRQMAWEEKMSSTARQREVADLKAAGLNPILAAGGSGASSPSVGVGAPPSAPAGAQAHVQKSEAAGYIQRAVTQAVSSALEVARLERENKVADSQIYVNSTVADKNMAEKQKTDAERVVASIEGERMAAELPSAKAKAKYSEKLAGVNAYAETTGKILDPITRAAGMVVPWIAGGRFAEKIANKVYRNWSHSARKVAGQ